jgi:hypothetical protein
LLGEDVLNHWIGAIEVAPRRTGWLSKLKGRSAQGSGMPLDALKPAVDALIESVRARLPSRPWHSDPEAGGTIWELHPAQADDYAHQLDMFVGKSVHPPMWQAAHSGRGFSSERFSRFGEVFCFVKLDGTEGLDVEKFADKAEIEDALDEVLKGIGCHVGGGTGLRYSYIDLALTDLREGVERVRQRLAQGNVPKRSWILFFDEELSGEWIGVYDDTPPPP